MHIQHDPDFKRLLRRLKRCGNSFSLFFARTNFHDFRTKISQQLKLSLTRPVVEIDISNKADTLTEITLDQYIAERVEKSAPNSIIFLYGLEHLLPTHSAETQHRVSQQINWRRNGFSALQRPLVIWLPEYALTLLAQLAPDFYDWYSGIYILDMDEIEKNKQQKKMSQSFNESEVHAAERMDTKEKKRWLRTLKELLDEAPEKNNHRAKLLNDLGRLYRSLGDRDAAMNSYQESLLIAQETGNKPAEGTTINNIAVIYRDRGDDKAALNSLKQSLAIRQRISDKPGKAITLNNIAVIYQDRGNYETALSYLKKSLEIQEDICDKSGKSATLNNISQIFDARGDYETALSYLKQAILIQQEIGDKFGESVTLNNIAQINGAKNDYETALSYFNQSLSIKREIGDTTGLCVTLFNMAHLHLQNGDKQEAIRLWAEVYYLAQKIHFSPPLKALEELAEKLGIKDGLDGWKALSKQQGHSEQP